MKFSLFSIYFLILLALLSCEQTKEVIYDPTNAELTVYNDLKQPQQGAIVRMYDSKEAYDESKTTGKEEGFAVKAVTDALGKASFKDLNSDRSYYFLISYRDRTRFVDLDNQDENYVFKEYLEKGTNPRIEIYLKQAKSIVSFFANTANKDQLPITLYIGDDSVGTISQSVASAPSAPFSASTITFRLSQGVSKWYARSAQGCLWSGNVLSSGLESFEPIAFGDCDAGGVTFYAGVENNKDFPIQISLNKNDHLGALTDGAEAAPGSCFSAGTVSAARATGTYNYIAESLRSGCVWSGSVTITKGGCQMVKLTPCQ